MLLRQFEVRDVRDDVYFFNLLALITETKNRNKIKTFSLAILLFLLCQNSFCQEKLLNIENRLSKKEITIKENKRIKVVTKTGEKFAGRFMVLDQNSISIDGVILDLSEIGSIRRHPLLYTIMIKANFFHMGTIAFLISLIPGSFPFVLVGVAHLTGGIYSGIKFPNISKGYKTENNWVFKIKGLPESNAMIGMVPIKQ